MVTVTFILWACLATSTNTPGACSYRPMEAFLTLAACKEREHTPYYAEKPTKCLPDSMRLYGNGEIK